METKICNCCKEIKSIEEFYKNQNYCKKCNSNRCKEYYQKNKDVIKKKTKLYSLQNKNKLKKYKKEYRKKNIEKITSYMSNYYKNNKEKMKKNNIKYYQKNKNNIREKKNEYQRKYRKENKDLVNQKRRLYIKEKKLKDKNFKLKEQIKIAIWWSFNKKGKVKSMKTEEIIGMSLNKFYYYLLETFKKRYGYEWNGIEKVHIDHIIPLATAKSEEEIIKLCHHTNLQLLKAIDNLKKGSKIL